MYGIGPVNEDSVTLDPISFPSRSRLVPSALRIRRRPRPEARDGGLSALPSSASSGAVRQGRIGPLPQSSTVFRTRRVTTPRHRLARSSVRTQYPGGQVGGEERLAGAGVAVKKGQLAASHVRPPQPVDGSNRDAVEAETGGVVEEHGRASACGVDKPPSV